MCFGKDTWLSTISLPSRYVAHRVSVGACVARSADAAAAQDDPNKPFAEVVLKDCIIGQTTVKECCFAIQSAGNTALFQAKVRLAPRTARRADRTPRRGRARSRPDRCVVASH